MPLAAYKAIRPSRCPHCKEGFELMESSASETLIECPRCGNAVQRQIISQIYAPKHLRKIGDVEAKDAGFTVYKKNGDGTYGKE